MKDYTSESLRNVVLMGHQSSGKTTLAESMLFASGAISRMGRVEDGNTVSDFDEVLARLRERFGTRVVPVVIPIGAGTAIEGSVDLLSGVASRGNTTGEAPPELTDAIAAAREMLVESVAETDDALLEKYLEG